MIFLFVGFDMFQWWFQNQSTWDYSSDHIVSISFYTGLQFHDIVVACSAASFQTWLEHVGTSKVREFVHGYS